MNQTISLITAYLNHDLFANGPKGKYFGDQIGIFNFFSPIINYLIPEDFSNNIESSTQPDVPDKFNLLKVINENYSLKTIPFESSMFQNSLELPLLTVDFAFTSFEDFLEKLKATNQSLVGVIHVEGDYNEIKKCPRCGKEWDHLFVYCRYCLLIVTRIRQYPLIPSAKINLSYNLLRQIVDWPEVISFGPQISLHSM